VVYQTEPHHPFPALSDRDFFVVATRRPVDSWQNVTESLIRIRLSGH